VPRITTTRIAFASFIGTAIVFYDFYIYGLAVAKVNEHLPSHNGNERAHRPYYHGRQIWIPVTLAKQDSCLRRENDWLSPL
jgi:hypothetical protein